MIASNNREFDYLYGKKPIFLTAQWESTLQPLRFI